jgi:hypothetical protein
VWLEVGSVKMAGLASRPPAGNAHRWAVSEVMIFEGRKYAIYKVAF